MTRIEHISAELSPLGIVIINENGFIKFINNRFQEITGIPIDELINKKEIYLDKLLSEKSASKLENNYFPCDKNAGRISFVNDKNLQTAILEKQCILRSFIEPCGCIFAISNPEIRYIKRTMRIKEDTEAGLTRVIFYEYMPDFQGLESIKRDFIVNAGHEFRTPLSLIIGYSEILQSYDADEDSKAWMLESILKNGKNLSSQIDQMLDLAAIDARIHSNTVLETLNIAEVFIDVCDHFVHSSDTRRPELVIEQGIFYCKGNKILLTKCLNELLTNAYQYSYGQGKIRLGLSIEPAGYYCIKIEDDGIGMSPAESVLATTRFWRADKSGRNPGIGLGLSIVKEIICLHGGNLEIISMIGKGTSVKILLPQLQ